MVLCEDEGHISGWGCAADGIATIIAAVLKTDAKGIHCNGVGNTRTTLIRMRGNRDKSSRIAHSWSISRGRGWTSWDRRGRSCGATEALTLDIPISVITWS